MISLLQQVVTSIHLKNYMSLVVITIVGYDYILIFSDEIEFIWNKPWTWISTLYVLARYSGLCGSVCYALWGSSFLSGPATPTANILIDVISLGFLARVASGFLCVLLIVGVVVMALRLWALYNQSRLILGILFVFFAMEVISFFVFYVSTFAQNQHGPVVGTVRVLELSFCVWEHLSGSWSLALYVFKIIFSALICLLITVKSGGELLQTYRATKRFQLNRYRKRLACEGTIYFATILVFSILDLLSFAGIQPTGEGRTIMAVVLQLQIPPITLIPRFILSLRKMYLRDGSGRRTKDIDTAFGLWSGSVGGMSTIVFGDGGPQNENDEQGDGIHMEEMAIKA